MMGIGQATRVPEGIDLIYPIKLKADYVEGAHGNIERDVIQRIVRLASHVKLKGSSSFTKKLEMNFPITRSVERLVFLNLTQPVMNVVFITDKSMITEVKSFGSPSSRLSDDTDYVEFTDYIHKDKTFKVRNENVSQFSAYSDETWIVPKEARKAEKEYWDRWYKINKLTGFVVNNDFMRLGQLYTSDVEEMNARKKITDAFASSNVSFIPKDYEFKPFQLYREELTAMYELIVQQYCLHYHFPPPLFYLKVDKHTDITLSSAYKQFKLACLKPILDPIIDHIAERLGEDIEADYTGIDVAGTKELLELSQTGVLQINELRDKVGEEEIAGGDEFPATAGAPERQGEGGMDG